MSLKMQTSKVFYTIYLINSLNNETQFQINVSLTLITYTNNPIDFPSIL